MTATAKLAMVNKALDAGRTVYLVTPLRATKVTPAVWNRFEAAGFPFLKVSASGSLRMAEGRRYVSADHVAIQVEA